MSYEFRTIPIGGGIWSAQAKEDLGTSFTLQVLGVFYDQPTTQGGNSVLTAQTQAHYACGGNLAARGGSYDPNNHDPFDA